VIEQVHEIDVLRERGGLLRELQQYTLQLPVDRFDCIGHETDEAVGLFFGLGKGSGLVERWILQKIEAPFGRGHVRDFLIVSLVIATALQLAVFSRAPALTRTTGRWRIPDGRPVIGRLPDVCQLSETYNKAVSRFSGCRGQARAVEDEACLSGEVDRVAGQR
jgi:hypothetical protein